MKNLGNYKLAMSALLVAGTAWAGRADRDFDGDGRADLAVYHAAKGDWYVRSSLSQGLLLQNWGWNQSQPVAGDFDGDGRADHCVYNARGGEWYIRRSSTGAQVVLRAWGSTEHDPVSGDFDGDGRSDVAVYHAGSGVWTINQSSDGRFVTWEWGNARGEPVPGDYDGDQITDSAIYDRSTGNWSIRQSSNRQGVFINWGWSEAEPVQADYDGDGRTDLAVYHPASGDWYIRRSVDSQLTLFRSGWYHVQPVPADFNGDGRADPAVYFAQQGKWLAHVSGLQEVRDWGWSGAEAACASYRVDDDGIHYNVNFGHDYDDDRFSVTGAYPRTGWHAPPPATPGGGTASPVDLGQVNWLHADVSGWAQTSKLRVKINKSTVSLSYDKAGVWPGTYSIGGATVAANPWIFVPQTDGTGWDGATWEWMKQGQTTKNRSSVAGDHIKKSPLNNFKPVPGQWYGFMVSGLARDRARNVSERSNVVMVQWPADGKESQWFE